ncbi:MAG: sigma-54 dependent transcriptional regulator [Acidobacteriia bacterium]|nr:sigma-54 dependent transcriptional regulator [Terriglobia bacterium]
MTPTASILLVDDDAAFRHVMAGELRRLGHEVAAAASGEEAITKAAELDPAIILLDLRLPGMDGLETLKTLRARAPAAEIVMLTGHGTIDTAIESIRAGAFDYVVKPCPLDELQIRIERALERRSLRQRANLLERGLTPPDLAGSFVGDSPEFRRLLHMIERVAPADSTVLITGETGSGKERVAKLIHARSRRKARPFVTVDCAALQESLLQSELFGHERGAFTGAERAKPGLFEVAHGGTIFLDEIGEVSRGDIDLLANHFVSTLNERFASSQRLSEAALALLRGHDWPGNIRELQHAIEAAMVVCEDQEILPAHLPPAVGGAPRPAPRGDSTLPTLDELERTHIRAALEASGGRRGQAARILGISERNLYRKLHELGLG